jgi:RNA polymerase sigma factor (sigma-70 family)
MSQTPQAFRTSLEAAYPIVYAYLYRRHHDAQLADEVSQDCIVQAYERHADDPSYFDGRDVLDWLRQRASWRSLDQYRRRGRCKTLPEEGNVQPLRANDFPEDNRQLAWSCLQRLPEQERFVLVLHHYDGLTDQEVGSRLFGERLSPRARGLRVWRLRQQAYQHLKTLLLEEGFEPPCLGEEGTDGRTEFEGFGGQAV